MKILHILDHSVPLQSGYAFRSRNILRSQRKAGLHPVALTSPKHEASWKRPVPPVEWFDGIGYYRSGPVRGMRTPGLDAWAVIQKLRSGIAEQLRRDRPDIVHAHSPVLNAVAALMEARRLGGLPVVYEIRAFWEDAAADLGTYAEGSARYRLVRALETTVCRLVDRVVTICDGLKRDLQARGVSPEKIQVVPNAVDPEEFSLPAASVGGNGRFGRPGTTTLAFIGSFYHYEGLDLLIEAFGRLVLQHRDLRLLLVGGGPMEAHLRDLADRRGLSGSVVFTGRISHAEVAQAYAAADLLVYPRKAMRLTELVTPLKPLEAMAMGKPVAASAVGGHRELIRHGETGLLFQPDSVESLVGAMGALVASAPLREGLGRRGQSWVMAERTWDANGGRYKALYEDCTGGRGFRKRTLLREVLGK